MSNVEHVKSLTSAIEEKCTSDLVEYLAASAYLTTWAVEAVNSAEGRRSAYDGGIPEKRFIDEDTTSFLRVAMGFSHIGQLVECVNEILAKEWQRVMSDLDKLTWHARVFDFGIPGHQAIGIDTSAALLPKHKSLWY